VAAAWVDGSERMSRMSASGEPVLHLQYRQIVSAPLDAVRAVYRHCGLVLTAEAEGRMRAWLGTSANANRPARKYNLAEFGLEPRALRELFARYMDVFGVDMEPDAREAGTGALS
jgi:hypothetical protein